MRGLLLFQQLSYEGHTLGEAQSATETQQRPIETQWSAQGTVRICARYRSDKVSSRIKQFKGPARRGLFNNYLLLRGSPLRGRN